MNFPMFAAVAGADAAPFASARRRSRRRTGAAGASGLARRPAGKRLPSDQVEAVRESFVTSAVSEADNIDRAKMHASDSCTNSVWIFLIPVL
jgi:hypothetical protein